LRPMSICFNTPKGHLCLQTRNRRNDGSERRKVSIPRRVTYACRQRRKIWRQILKVSIPRRVTYACRLSDLIPVPTKHEFQYPEGSLPPSDINQKYQTSEGRAVSQYRERSLACPSQQSDGHDNAGFNTPKGHCHLQTTRRRAVLGKIYCVSIP